LGTRGWIKTDQEFTEFVQKNDDVLNKGAYRNLLAQLNKLARHSKGVSLTTMRQYYHIMDLFLRFLADEYGVQNLSNIAGKHVAAYIEERQLEGKSPSTIKNDIAGIRYYFDQLSLPRHRFPSNQELFEKYGVSLQRRSFGGVNRRWTWEEVNHMIQVALRRERNDIAAMIRLGSGLGLRIHEIVRLNRSDVEKALRTNQLTVKGKGGLIRSIPLTDSMLLLLRNIIVDTERGQKIFVPTDRKAHEIIRSAQMFLQQHRQRVEQIGARPKGVSLTFHGLRHLFAFDQYNKFIELGFSESAARYKVAELIGHSREDVTRIYLAKGENEDGRVRTIEEANIDNGEKN
jgi:integrase/recombinase XerD